MFTIGHEWLHNVTTTIQYWIHYSPLPTILKIFFKSSLHDSIDQFLIKVIKKNVRVFELPD